MSTNVKIIREKMNLTQLQLSLIIKVSVRCVKSWEQGERTIGRSSAEKLRKAYRSSQKKILSLDEIYLIPKKRKGINNGKPMGKALARNAK
jgi:transcriptional regulator with XRE-family HTH domain